jgi:hypothetical protein
LCEETAEHVVDCDNGDRVEIEDVSKLGEVREDVRDRLVVQVSRVLKFLDKVSP